MTAQCTAQCRNCNASTHRLGGCCSRSCEKNVCDTELQRNIYECCCCDRYAWATSPAELRPNGWRLVMNIDGPNTICPECVEDPEALDALKSDGYENAYVK